MIRASVGTREGARRERAQWQGLHSRLAGALLTPGDDGYERARRAWNGMIDRRPTPVARCAATADVVAGVNFAREHGLTLSVRGGGHNDDGQAVCEGGLMVDRAPMKGIVVDAAARTARAEGGLTLGEFDRATQAHGLATPLGVATTTGITGLTLGGWLRPAGRPVRPRVR